MKYEEIPLVDNVSAHHLELQVEGVTAFIDYKKTADKLFLIHTEVPAALEGKGAGSVIVEKAFQFVEQHNLKIVPLCAFVQLFLKRHPQWTKLIADDAERFMKN